MRELNSCLYAILLGLEEGRKSFSELKHWVQKRLKYSEVTFCQRLREAVNLGYVSKKSGLRLKRDKGYSYYELTPMGQELLKQHPLYGEVSKDRRRAP